MNGGSSGTGSGSSSSSSSSSGVGDGGVVIVFLYCSFAPVLQRIHPVLKGEVTVFPEKVDQGKSIVDLYRSTGKGPVHIVQGHAGGC